jgi:selenocysteine lyase/cysteine desulfurase
VAESGDSTISGIASYHRAHGRALEQVAEELMQRGVVGSLRHDRSGRAHLRFSPHFYNTVAELDEMAEILRKMID